jgi:hypothetical protein
VSRRAANPRSALIALRVGATNRRRALSREPPVSLRAFILQAPLEPARCARSRSGARRATLGRADGQAQACPTWRTSPPGVAAPLTERIGRLESYRSGGADSGV